MKKNGPRKEEMRFIVLFESIHHVLATERLFKKADAWCNLMPVPRKLSSDCGMALEYHASDAELARTILDDPKVKWDSMWKPEGKGYERVHI